MTNACEKTSGTSTTNCVSVLFFCFHCSLAIIEPSRNGCPLPGTPDLYALIILVFATVTLSTPSVRDVDANDQSSYPLKPANLIPLGDPSLYLSSAAPPEPART